MLTTENLYTCLFIAAWREPEGGWTWDNMFTIEEDIYLDPEFTARGLLAMCRRAGWLTDHSKGRVRVEDTGYYIEVQDKNTGEPLIAFRPQWPI